MKAEQLRIGNYLHNPKNGNVFQVCREDFKFEKGLANLEDYEPIELTEEWLLKMGFEKEIIDCNHIRRIYYYIYDFEVEFHGKKLVFRVETENSTRYFAHKTRHIHQLQNLYFALTGEELRIKN